MQLFPSGFSGFQADRLSPALGSAGAPVVQLTMTSRSGPLKIPGKLAESDIYKRIAHCKTNFNGREWPRMAHHNTGPLSIRKPVGLQPFGRSSLTKARASYQIRRMSSHKFVDPRPSTGPSTAACAGGSVGTAERSLNTGLNPFRSEDVCFEDFKQHHRRHGWV